MAEAAAAAASTVCADSAEAGLSEAVAAERLRSEGANALPTPHRRRLLALLAEIAREPMILLLLVCSGLYLALGEPREGAVLLASVGVVIAISLYQTQRTEGALAALRTLASPRARVLRDGVERSIPAADVVRGDRMCIAEGERIAADGVVCATAHIEIDESLLSGESVPVRKRVAAPGGVMGRGGNDESAAVFSGSLVVAGEALITVTATGPRTEIGRIGASLATVEQRQTPLQQQVARAVTIFGAAGGALCVLVAVLYGLARAAWMDGLLAGIALAMALMPEEFPVILTLFLAFGAWRIARRNVLIRHMPALEALGATAVLCVDKTGTLTENRLRLAVLSVEAALWAPDGGTAPAPEAFHALLEYAVLASRQHAFDPIDVAILTAAAPALAGSDRLHSGWTMVREYPLSPALLSMAQVWRSGDGTLAVAAKGAPEAIIDLCHLPESTSLAIAAQMRDLAARGLRVLAVAAAQWPAVLPEQQHDFPFTFLGLLGFADPVRHGVPQAIGECQRAGIRVVMITGDSAATARAIATQIGLRGADAILTGAEVNALADDALAERLRAASVFARISPAQKLRLVRAFGASGRVVAMTGDGINDAPALRAATIGIAMGRRGTDVAREAADLVLLDDDFTSIVSAVRLGRRISDNIRKAMHYVVAIHIPVAGVAVVPVLFGWPLVLLPLHIVLLELIVDPACSIAFEAEPEEPGIMQRPPAARAQMFGAGSLRGAILQGGWALAVLIGLLAGMTAMGSGELRMRSVVFSAVVLANLALILSSRSDLPGLRGLRRHNGALWTITGGALASLIAALSFAPARDVLRLAAPTRLDIGAIAIAGALLLGGCEAIKALLYHRRTQPASR
ncbi:MAG: cation-translocating P-type ATPase [bacterium]